MLRVNQLIGFGVGGAKPPPTFDPARTDGDITLSGGNLSGSATSGPGGTMSTGILTAGKAYTELRITGLGSTTARQRIGIGRTDWDYTTAPGNGYSWVYFASGRIRGEDSESGSWGGTWSVNDIIGVAVDRDAGRIWFALNNVWQASGDPAGNTNPAFDDADIIGSLHIIAGTFSAVSGTFSWTWRSSPADHSYSPPSGFSAVWPS